MAIGYFIRVGDKTSCGGTVLEGAPDFSLDGAALARAGDRVTCGKDGKVYSIAGGVHHFMVHAPAAGTLDSFSTCPCRARLIALSHGMSYHSDNNSSRASSALVSTVSAMPFTTRPSRAEPKPAMHSVLEEEEEEEELVDAGIVLRLGLFFDGTGNNQANSAATEGCYAVSLGMSHEVGENIRQYCATYGYDGKGNTPDNSYGNDASNVARLHDLYPDQTEERLTPGAQEAYISVYIEGIGTRSSLGDSIYSQASGKGETGVVARVEQMPALVLKQLRRFKTANPDLMIRRFEIDLFGFSRGAAAARHCANDLLKGPDSLLARSLPAGSPLLAANFTWRHRSDLVLNFIGLFDTVAGIVSLRNGDFSPHNADNPGLNLRLDSGIARRVVHLVARDEYRHNFSLNEAIQDIELPGCHSDIGGGYLPLAREKLLLSKPDSSVELDLLANERSAAFARTKQRFYQEAPHWQTFVPSEGLDIVTWSVPIQHRTRDNHAQKRVYAAITSEREVRGELSLVYLRIMREWAVRTGVAFEAINDRLPHLALPAELQPIAAKLRTTVWLGLLLWLAGCANGAHRLPYDSWRLGLFAPNYMEVWIETADAVDVQDRVFGRAMSGIAAINTPENFKGDPRGWPEQPGAGKGKQVLGADLPRLLYVRWQSLAEPQTYEAYIVIPEATQRAMLKGEKTFCEADAKWITDFRDMLTIGLAPGGIAKIWLMGACLSVIDVARVQGTVVKEGPYLGKASGYYRPPNAASQAYIDKFGIPYGSW